MKTGDGGMFPSQGSRASEQFTQREQRTKPEPGKQVCGGPVEFGDDSQDREQTKSGRGESLPSSKQSSAVYGKVQCLSKI